MDTHRPLGIQGEIAVRQRWLAVLATAPLERLEASWNSLADRPAYRMLRRGETGLVMVRGRIGGSGQPFNFGEMTMTRAAVQLLDAAGNVSRVGFGHVTGRSARKAELVALFDALLQDPARYDSIAERIVEPLAAEQDAAKADRAAKVMASKVDFFTMVRGE